MFHSNNDKTEDASPYPKATGSAPPTYMESFQHDLVTSSYAHPSAPPGSYQQRFVNSAYYPQVAPSQVYYPGQYVFYQPYGATPSLPVTQQPMYYPGQNILFQGAFDSGARFDAMTPPAIPPAPPGVAPNAAQLAAMSGANVAASQQKGSFWSGGSSGGYTLW